MARFACNLVGCGQVNGGLIVFKYGSGLVLWESYVSSELSKENDIFGAATECEVFCFTGAEGDT